MDDKILKKERNKVLLMFLLYPFIVILIIIISFKLLSNINDYKVINYVKKNSKQLEKYIKGEIDKSDLVDGVIFKDDFEDNQYCNDETCFIKFEVGASGFATNSCYVGFYYTNKDIMHKYEFRDRTVKGISNKSYTVEEIGGDNILYLKKIKKHWYYYKDCY